MTASTANLSQAQRAATDPGDLRFRQVLEIHRNASRTADSTVNRAGSVTSALLTSLEHWNCQTDANPTHGTDEDSDYILACNRQRTRVYLLAPATLDGSDVQSASAGLDAHSPIAWVVNLKFTGAGSGRWLTLTKQTYEATGTGESGYPTCKPPTGCNAIGIVLDGLVQSDPATEVDGIPGGLTQISGNFSQSEADFLATVLRAGQLPIPLHRVN